MDWFELDWTMNRSSGSAKGGLKLSYCELKLLEQRHRFRDLSLYAALDFHYYKSFAFKAHEECLLEKKVSLFL